MEEKEEERMALPKAAPQGFMISLSFGIFLPLHSRRVKVGGGRGGGGRLLFLPNTPASTSTSIRHVDKISLQRKKDRRCSCRIENEKKKGFFFFV